MQEMLENQTRTERVDAATQQNTLSTFSNERQYKSVDGKNTAGTYAETKDGRVYFLDDMTYSEIGTLQEAHPDGLLLFTHSPLREDDQFKKRNNFLTNGETDEYMMDRKKNPDTKKYIPSDNDSNIFKLPENHDGQYTSDSGATKYDPSDKDTTDDMYIDEIDPYDKHMGGAVPPAKRPKPNPPVTDDGVHNANPLVPGNGVSPVVPDDPTKRQDHDLPPGVTSHDNGYQDPTDDKKPSPYVPHDDIYNDVPMPDTNLLNHDPDNHNHHDEGATKSAANSGTLGSLDNTLSMFSKHAQTSFGTKAATGMNFARFAALSDANATASAFLDDMLGA